MSSTLKVVDYNIEYDSIELMYQTGTNTVMRVATLKDINNLLESYENGELDGAEEILYGIVGEIQRKGGMEWIRDRVDERLEENL